MGKKKFEQRFIEVIRLLLQTFLFHFFSGGNLMRICEGRFSLFRFSDGISSFLGKFIANFAQLITNEKCLDVKKTQQLRFMRAIKTVRAEEG